MNVASDTPKSVRFTSASFGEARTEEGDNEQNVEYSGQDCIDHSTVMPSKPKEVALSLSKTISTLTECDSNRIGAESNIPSTVVTSAGSSASVPELVHEESRNILISPVRIALPSTSDNRMALRGKVPSWKAERAVKSILRAPSGCYESDSKVQKSDPAIRKRSSVKFGEEQIFSIVARAWSRSSGSLYSSDGEDLQLVSYGSLDEEQQATDLGLRAESSVESQSNANLDVTLGTDQPVEVQKVDSGDSINFQNKDLEEVTSASPRQGRNATRHSQRTKRSATPFSRVPVTLDSGSDSDSDFADIVPDLQRPDSIETNLRPVMGTVSRMPDNQCSEESLHSDRGACPPQNAPSVLLGENRTVTLESQTEATRGRGLVRRSSRTRTPTPFTRERTDIYAIGSDNDEDLVEIADEQTTTPSAAGMEKKFVSELVNTREKQNGENSVHFSQSATNSSGPRRDRALQNRSYNFKLVLSSPMDTRSEVASNSFSGEAQLVEAVPSKIGLDRKLLNEEYSAGRGMHFRMPGAESTLKTANDSARTTEGKKDELEKKPGNNHMAQETKPDYIAREKCQDRRRGRSPGITKKGSRRSQTPFSRHIQPMESCNTDEEGEADIAEPNGANAEVIATMTSTAEANVDLRATATDNGQRDSAVLRGRLTNADIQSASRKIQAESRGRALDVTKKSTKRSQTPFSRRRVSVKSNGARDKKESKLQRKETSPSTKPTAANTTGLRKPMGGVPSTNVANGAAKIVRIQTKPGSPNRRVVLSERSIQGSKKNGQDVPIKSPQGKARVSSGEQRVRYESISASSPKSPITPSTDRNSRMLSKTTTKRSKKVAASTQTSEWSEDDLTSPCSPAARKGLCPTCSQPLPARTE